MANNRIKLRMLMAENDLSAQDVADKLGYQLTTIHMWISKSEERNISDADLKELRANLRKG